MNITLEQIEQVKAQLNVVAPEVASYDNIDNLIDAISVRVSKDCPA